MSIQKRKPTSAKVGSLEMSNSLAAIDTGENTKGGISPQTKWKLANPKAIWAQQALRSALNRGLIIQLPCRECGALDAEAHHPDYDRPMDVDWLCRLHHRREHKRLKCEAVT